MRTRRHLPAAAVLACVLAGCGDRVGGPTDPGAPTHRLAEEVAATAGGREAAADAVGDVTRYVLAERPSALVYPVGNAPRQVEADASGEADVVLACPRALAGRRVYLTAAWADLVDGEIESRTQELGWKTCPAGDPSSLPVHLTGLPPSRPGRPTVNAHAPAAERVETPWITLGADATLRLALGVAHPGAVEGAVAARFRLTAEGRAHETVSLLDRVLDPGRKANERQWTDLAVGLDAARRRLGPELRLRFETQPVGGAEGSAFPLWGDPTVFEPRPDPPPWTNVVLVSVDALRADRLGCYGFAQPTSPSLDRLAREGTVFDVAIAQANWTRPSHATMLSGTYACVHGLEAIQTAGLPPRLSPLPEILRRTGYATAAFTEDGNLSASVFQRGFGVFRANPIVGKSGPTGLIEDTVASAETWLRREAVEPFFLFVHTYQVHEPYRPPPRYRDLFVPEHAAEQTPIEKDSLAYNQEVRYADDVLGSFFARLDRLGLTRRTVVIVTSDHGEAFGEHGTVRHAGSMFEEELRVPLLWRAPGIIAAGRREGSVVGLVDVVPTVLELLGLPAPPWMQGTSLAAVLRPGEVSAAQRERVVFAESALLRQVAARADGWKAIFAAPGASVYRIVNDPHEREPETDGPLLAAADAARKAFGAECRRVRALVEEKDGESAAVPPPADLERARKLRALGYVE